MKITQLREKDGNLTLSTTDLDTFLQKIKTETKTQPVSTFRQQLRYCLPGKRCNEADRLPKVLPAAEFRKTNGVCQMKTYNGIVELTVGPLSGKSEIALVKRLAWEQPQTRLVFTGSSGRTVKIWTTFTRPNNSLPGKREEAEVFHAHAYRLAVRHSAERAQAGTVLPPLLRPRSHVPPGLHTVLSCTARLHARRNHLSGSPARREVTPDARRAGI